MLERLPILLKARTVSIMSQVDDCHLPIPCLGINYHYLHLIIDVYGYMYVFHAEVLYLDYVALGIASKSLTQLLPCSNC